MMRIIRFVPDYFRIISGLFDKGVKTRFRGLWRFWPCRGTGLAICVAWRPVSGGFRGYSERVNYSTTMTKLCAELRKATA